MTLTMKWLAVLCAAFALAGCGEKPSSTAPTAPKLSGNLLELEAAGMQFFGPDEIKSGWTTVRLKNLDPMTHFALIYPLPEGVTVQRLSDEAIDLFQAILTAQINGDNAEVETLLAQMPVWISDIVFMGGPGMLAGGETSEATLYLEPGNYVIECYVKTNGYQHNYNPDPDTLGMVHALTVLDENGGGVEPAANATLEISNSGYAFTEGALHPGANTVKVNFVEQALYGGLVGHDAHVFRIENDTDVDEVSDWMNFFPVDGLASPAPAHFVGGIHDMPEGSIAYFTLNLEPGEYGVIAEIPEAKESGFFTTFTVEE